MPTISFKVTGEEARLLRAKARAERATVSAYVRKHSLGGAAEQGPELRLQRHPVSGLPFNVAAGVTATEAQIADALVAFP